MHAAATNEAQQAASEAEEAAREARDFQSELQSSHEAALKKHSDTASLEIESLEAKVTVEASLVEDLQTKLESVGEEVRDALQLPFPFTSPALAKKIQFPVTL